MAATFPSPRSSSTLHTTRRQPGAIPAYRPLEHFPFPHRQPATWVPCPLSSYGCFCPPTKSANPAILPERSGCSAIPVSSTAARHTFSGKPVYLCRGRVDNSLYPVQGIRILFLLGYGKMGEEVCCILWKTAKKPACSPGSSAPANDRKSVSKIFLPRKKPGQACGHILNHNYPFGGS